MRTYYNLKCGHRWYLTELKPVCRHCGAYAVIKNLPLYVKVSHKEAVDIREFEKDLNKALKNSDEV